MDTKRFFPALFVMAASLISTGHAKDVDTSLEESLELRRISEYWKEKDYPTVKVQIHEFLSKNPKSSYLDQLYAMLGDLNFQEKNYTEAVAAYDKIQNKEFRGKTQFHRLHSLYETGKYDEFILQSELFLNDPNAKAAEISTIRFELGEAYFCKAHAPENEKNKKELLKEALAQYNQVMQTKYGDLAILPVAQIHASLEEYAKAASLYLLLAHKDAGKKEEHLFQAACLQLNVDKKAATETFGMIADIGGKLASKAAFNQLNLLFQEKRYKDFILAQDKVMKHVPQDKVPLMRYYLGKSLFQTRDFASAVDPLSQSLGSKTLDRAQEKSALITLIACARETKDLPLFEKALSHLKSEFSGDEETASILMMHSQLCREKKEWAKARSDIKELLENSPRHPQREALIYDSAVMLTQEGKLQEAATKFEAFLQEFPQSSHKPSALRHLVSARLEDLKTASPETLKIKQEALLDSLQLALEEKKTFSPAEKQKMRYLFGKTLFELGKYDEAIGELSEYARDFHKDPTSSDAYLLLAYCYQMGSRDEIHFSLNAEKALGLNPRMQGALDLHLTLFNTYLSLAGKAPADEKKELIGKAADHLFLALDKPVSKENQRWLAGYYFQQYQNGQHDAVERAAIVLEKLLGIKEDSYTLEIHAQSLDMEGEAVKLSDIYAKTGRMKQRVQLLEALSQQQKTQPELNWKYQRMAQFELGKAYLCLGEKDKAVKTYADLISSSARTSSYFAIAAQVEKAKLEFSMLKGVEKYEDSKTALAICDTLKDVQSKRKLHSEPLHLEAALTYVEIKSELAPDDQKESRRFFLLQKMKESFSSMEDPLVAQYLSAAGQFPDKERLYHQYLTYVDAEMLRLDGKKDRNGAKLREAKGKFDQLLTESSDDTLTERIRKSTEALATDL
ncbi:MAG: tetratricopeptide repeat protein [Verrucomicrobia bacterium]|nr:tetratricopeptide repeat protein [Verrucomicrobiota bacterium]